MSPVSQRRGLRTKARKESFRLQVLADCDFGHMTANAGINFGDFVSRIDHTQVKAKNERRRRLFPSILVSEFHPGIEERPVAGKRFQNELTSYT
jgi:hypothetical protein